MAGVRLTGERVREKEGGEGTTVKGPDPGKQVEGQQTRFLATVDTWTRGQRMFAGGYLSWGRWQLPVPDAFR